MPQGGKADSARQPDDAVNLNDEGLKSPAVDTDPRRWIHWVPVEWRDTRYVCTGNGMWSLPYVLSTQVPPKSYPSLEGVRGREVGTEAP